MPTVGERWATGARPVNRPVDSGPAFGQHMLRRRRESGGGPGGAARLKFATIESVAKEVMGGPGNPGSVRNIQVKWGETELEERPAAPGEHDVFGEKDGPGDGPGAGPPQGRTLKGTLPRQSWKRRPAPPPQGAGDWHTRAQGHWRHGLAVGGGVTQTPLSAFCMQNHD
jgi:hypothetical protein